MSPGVAQLAFEDRLDRTAKDGAKMPKDRLFWYRGDQPCRRPPWSCPETKSLDAGRRSFRPGSTKARMRMRRSSAWSSGRPVAQPDQPSLSLVQRFSDPRSCSSGSHLVWTKRRWRCGFQSPNEVRYTPALEIERFQAPSSGRIRKQQGNKTALCATKMREGLSCRSDAGGLMCPRAPKAPCPRR